MIEERIYKTIEKIESAKKRSADHQDVKLICVTKTKPIEMIEIALNCGQRDIGENKVQELKEKMDILGDSINYHMIGNLQTNKVKYIYDRVNLIQSLDRVKLAKEIQKYASRDNISVDCLVEINLAGEEQKGGVSYDKTLDFFYELQAYDSINVVGIMTVAPISNDDNYLKALFKKMYELRNEIDKKNFTNANMKYLSMGMSSDYELAIEEGSNMVRIGSAIFGERNY